MVERLLQLDIHVRNWLSPLLGLNREKIANFIPTADILIVCANLCASDVYRAIDKICNTLNCSTGILTLLGIILCNATVAYTVCIQGLCVRRNLIILLIVHECASQSNVCA